MMHVKQNVKQYFVAWNTAVSSRTFRRSFSLVHLFKYFVPPVQHLFWFVLCDCKVDFNFYLTYDTVMILIIMIAGPRKIFVLCLCSEQDFLI